MPALISKISLALSMCFIPCALAEQANSPSPGDIFELGNDKLYQLTLRYVSGKSKGRIYRLHCDQGGTAKIGQAPTEDELRMTESPKTESCEVVRQFIAAHRKPLEHEATTPRRPPLSIHALWGTLSLNGIDLDINPAPETLCSDPEFKHCQNTKTTSADELGLLLQKIITRRLGRLEPPLGPAHP